MSVPVHSQTTILIVDDEPAIVDALRSMLVDDYRVACCDNAESATEYVRVHAPRIVVTDCLLPGSIERLLSQADASGTAALLMSGSAETLDRFAAQGRRILMKPFRIAEFVAAVENAC